MGSVGESCDAAAEFHAVQEHSRAIDRPAARDARAFYNTSKNRYRDVVPSDGARVRLSSRSGEIGSDYINASMIEYPNDSQRYIAAQAPLPSTIEDFWRMVWEQESGVIVMLTNNVERNRIKAHPYFPSREGESVRHGAATVSLMRSTSFHGMSVRSIRLHMESNERGGRASLTSSFNSYFGGPARTTRMGAKSPPSFSGGASVHGGAGRPRLIYHIQYCAWPDFGVPTSTEGVQEALKLMHTCLRGSRSKGLSGPPVVHCSAGIGRTGTFITADIAQRLMAGNHKVCIASIVSWLRQQRFGMVQTEDQYVFIYRLLHDWLATRLRDSDDDDDEPSFSGAAHSLDAPRHSEAATAPIISGFGLGRSFSISGLNLVSEAAPEHLGAMDVQAEDSGSLGSPSEDVLGEMVVCS